MTDEEKAKEIAKGFSAIEINGVTFHSMQEMLVYMNNLRKENAKLSQMLELATHDNSRLHLISKGWFNIDKGYDEALTKAKEGYRAELEKRVKEN